jgi:NAD(P)-dependent dehydrogenase (short-subunit alcohol dehydrogenase family)
VCSSSDAQRKLRILCRQGRLEETWAPRRPGGRATQAGRSHSDRPPWRRRRRAAPGPRWTPRSPGGRRVRPRSDEGCAAFVAGDVRERAYCERVVAETVERLGGVDIPFNNAGIIPRGTILETSDDMWHAALDVNLTAMFYLCRSATPAMKERGGGAIVNTSSVWGAGAHRLLHQQGSGGLLLHEPGARPRARGHPGQRHLPTRDQHADAALRVRAPGAGSAEGRGGPEQDRAAG